MKKIIFFSAFLTLFIASSALAQLRTVTNTAFKRGELLRYKVYYDAILTGKVVAGEAELEVKDENKLIGGRSTFHIVGLGLTKGTFNLFYKVVDRYESYVDEQALIPWIFIRRVNEGGYKISQDVTFNQYSKTAITVNNKNNTTTNTVVSENMHDIISLFYYARTIDFSSAYVGQEFPVPFFIDDTVYTSKIIYQGKENVTIGLGTYKAIKFKPSVATGNVFSEDYPLTIWISDDKNHVPLFAESAILVGTVKMELIKFSGLANAVTSKSS